MRLYDINLPVILLVFSNILKYTILIGNVILILYIILYCSFYTINALICMTWIEKAYDIRTVGIILLLIIYYYIIWNFFQSCDIELTRN